MKIKRLILKEHLKEMIGETRVSAALFYTFNFDTEFFENYLLPLFVSKANFTDNKIANSILWRQYQKDLPPITIYCDFHAKSSKAPQLNYVIRPIDIKRESGARKPCFHPKLSLILLDNGKLLVISGSNNLTDDGWCKNIEAVSILTIQNGETSFPREFKDSLWEFMDDIKNRYGNNTQYSHAEEKLASFFRQRRYMKKNYNNKFISSIGNDFWKIISDIKSENGNSPFEDIEIMSPYFSKGIGLLKILKNLTELNKIKCLVPYQGINEVAMKKDLFDQYVDHGVTWSKPAFKYEGKGYRFNHCKVYRIKCAEYMYTIIGSYNFTEAAFDGESKKGNIESAIVYKEPSDNWESYLTQQTSWAGVLWAEDNPDEEKVDEKRLDAPNLEFTIDWQEKTIKFINPDNIEALFSIANFKRAINKKKEEFILDDKILEYLADSSLITVYYKTAEFYYYPSHIGIEFKPLSSSLARLSDGELLSIWEQLNDSAQIDISDIIEKHICSISDEAGDIINNKTIVANSTLNMMASHLSGLINLQKNIFREPKSNKDVELLDERIKYYLFTDNLDTLIGYRKLLKKLLEEGKIFRSFYWLILNIIEIGFYNKVKKSWIKDLNKVYDNQIKIINQECEEVREKLVNTKEYRLSKEHLNWARKMLEAE